MTSPFEDQQYCKTTLGNGLRILSAPMPGTRSVSVSLYVGAGSRYETPSEAGLSHLLEHLLFKGSEKRPSAQLISETIDSVGGVMNAGTDRELTVYYAKVARPHFQRAADVLADMIRHPLIEAAEIEKERKVVIEELASIEDSPAQLVDVRDERAPPLVGGEQLVEAIGRALAGEGDAEGVGVGAGCAEVDHGRESRSASSTSATPSSEAGGHTQSATAFTRSCAFSTAIP